MKKMSVLFWTLIITVFFISCNGDNTAGNNGVTDANNTDVSKSETDSTRNDMHHDSLSQAGSRVSTVTVPDFVMKAASGGMMEVALGKMAQQKAKNQRIKNYGKMLVQDHTNANNELKGIASSKSITVRSEMMADHKNHVDEMSKMSGAEFEKAYIHMMVDDHQKDIGDFKNASDNLSDAEIKSFASKTLPVLQKHLDSARAINLNL